MGNESFSSELELQRSPIDLDNDPMIKSNFKIMIKVSVPAFGKADNKEYKYGFNHVYRNQITLTYNYFAHHKKME